LLKKKDGGVRSIAVGETLRRLTAEWLLATSQGRSETAALAPLQTAFAKGSPCDVVAMGVQALTDTLHGSTGWLLLQVDLKKAFTSIHRPAILDALEQRCPSMLPWVRQALQPAPLIVGREVIWSTQGFRRLTLGPFPVRRGHPGSPRCRATSWGFSMGSVAELEGVLTAFQ